MLTLLSVDLFSFFFVSQRFSSAVSTSVVLSVSLIIFSFYLFSIECVLFSRLGYIS
jgi:hypothetical protein